MNNNVADKIYREIRVSSFVSLRELGEADSDEEVLVRGISEFDHRVEYSPLNRL